jgi:hypothetical protein
MRQTSQNIKKIQFTQKILLKILIKMSGKYSISPIPPSNPQKNRLKNSI